MKPRPGAESDRSARLPSPEGPSGRESGATTEDWEVVATSDIEPRSPPPPTTAGKKAATIVEVDPLDVEIAAPEKTQPSSLSTGTRIIEDRATSGHGELEAINGTHEDAVLVVVDASSEVRDRAVYIKAQDTTTVRHLNAGSYVIAFATGTDWNELKDEFNDQAAYYKYERNVEFEETDDRSAIHYDHDTITLYPVFRGNVRIQRLTAAQFHTLTGIIKVSTN